VEALGAKIIVKTALPQGTVFIVIIPITGPIAEAAHPIRM
jgi:signal transduction histidine kinase